MAGLKGTYRYMEDANGVLQPNIFENDGMADLAQDNYLRQFKYNPRKYRHVKPVQMTNPGGVLAPAIIGAGLYAEGKTDLIGKGYNALPSDQEVYNSIQNSYGNWLDDKYNAVADWYNPKPDMMAEGPLSRNSRANAPRRQYDGRTNEYFMTIPGTNVQRVWSAEPTAEVAQEVIPSHEIPGYDRMVNEGYDSWSPSDSYVTEDWKTRASNRWEDHLHDRGRSQDARHPHQWKESDNRSDWQKWKDSLKQGWEAK